MHYRTEHAKLGSQRRISQQELDRLLRKKTPANREAPSGEALPKGLTKATLQTVNDCILAQGTAIFSTEDVAKATNISRVSVRKYLKFLTDIGYLEETLVYGVGRPIYQYQLNRAEQHRIHSYL